MSTTQIVNFRIFAIVGILTRWHFWLLDFYNLTLCPQNPLKIHFSTSLTLLRNFFVFFIFDAFRAVKRLDGFRCIVTRNMAK